MRKMTQIFTMAILLSAGFGMAFAFGTDNNAVNNPYSGATDIVDNYADVNDATDAGTVDVTDAENVTDAGTVDVNEPAGGSTVALTGLILDPADASGATIMNKPETPGANAAASANGKGLSRAFVLENDKIFEKKPLPFDVPTELDTMSIPLKPGLNVFDLSFSGLFPDVETYGAVLFFDDAQTKPQIAVYNANGSMEPFKVQPAGMPVMGNEDDSEADAAPGTSTYTTPDGTKVEVVSFAINAKTSATDKFSADAVAPDGKPDAVGKLILKVTVPEQPANEDDSGDIDIPGVSIQCGSEVTVPVRIQNALNAIQSIGFEIPYDVSVLTFTGFEKAGTLLEGFTQIDVNEAAAGLIRVGAYSETGISAGASGEIIKLTFKVTDCGEEDVVTELAVQELQDDIDGWKASPGYVKATEKIKNICKGDVNRSGRITPKDSLLVFEKYMGICPTSDGIPCEDICGDVNGDGKVSPADALTVFNKYLGKPSFLDSLDLP